MTDFVQRALRPERYDWPVRSLMDIDFYKLLMYQSVHTHYRNVPVTFSLINRATHIPVARIVPEVELRAALDHVRSLRFTRTDLTYVRGLDVYGAQLFTEETLTALAQLHLPAYELRVVGDQYELTFSGTWPEVMLWETMALAVVSQLYFQHLTFKMSEFELEHVFATAKLKLWRDLSQLQEEPELRFADFGQRRRMSFLWHQYVMRLSKHMMGEQLAGISNTYFAFENNLVPIGTNAHELQMVTAALARSDETLRDGQFEICRQWFSMFGRPLSILLTDTFGSWQFFKNAPADLAVNSRGVRQDSGDPFAFGERVIEWYREHGQDPREKLIIFSDGLTAPKMLELHRHFAGRIGTSFGWGTHLTNGFADTHPYPDQAVPGLDGITWDEAFRPFSLVCKVTAANGRPAVKLSDNPGKATGDPDEVNRYRAVFHAEQGQSRQAVEV